MRAAILNFDMLIFNSCYLQIGGLVTTHHQRVMT
jgi:hypothetical protein